MYDIQKNLALTCRTWSRVAKNETARAEWVIYHYGKAHALFHAVRLGPTFINLPVAQAIITRSGILSRYFVQKLLVHYGGYDFKLIELKIVHNVGQISFDRIKTLKDKSQEPWASNLELDVFAYFLTVAQKQFDTNEFYLKGNDMELFHFLSGGPHSINLILRMKFIPFPPRPSKSLRAAQNIPEEYPPKDGYENNRQLNVIARAILYLRNLYYITTVTGYPTTANGINQLDFQAICNIFKIYCNAHLDMISQCTSQDILAPLFKYYLPDLFNVKISFEMPMRVVEDKCARVQRQNNNRQLPRPQNAGRQAPRPQNTPNLFTDTLTAVQQYNDLVEGSNPFIRTQDVETSPQSTQLSRDLFFGFSFT
ncbi:hypothetical protein C2G38_2161351 [Gigaspora rosea]|uniref:Uncharacterized protein n=1 Tax=Gigaspora rosea TaxID=44941 RepID=A0A397VYY0_9GLOM|nr:hypothetical protein C2G38_2161351 [Gigaspora rosea]